MEINSINVRDRSFEISSFVLAAMQNEIKPSEVQISGLQENYRKFELSLYEENKAKTVQDTERLKPWKVQKGRSRMSLQLYKFVETYIKKKKGREKERQRNVFLCIANLNLWRGVRCTLHGERTNWRVRIYFQDLGSF